MANGDLSLGIVSAGSTQTSSADVTICSWTVPNNTTVRVAVNCIVQKVVDSTIKSSYVLTATLKKATGDVSIAAGPTTIRTEVSSAAMTITMGVSGNNIIIKTATPDGTYHRVSAFIEAYIVEQAIS
jgi:hypothetical protein